MVIGIFLGSDEFFSRIRSRSCPFQILLVKDYGFLFVLEVFITYFGKCFLYPLLDFPEGVGLDPVKLVVILIPIIL